MDIFEKYYEMFNDIPPILMTVGEDNEKYIALVKNAIERKKRLSGDELDKAFAKYDTIINFDEDYDNDVTD